MRIVVLEGSSHKRGSSNMLAHEFIRGAREKGNSVTVLDVAHMRLNHCLGCDACRKGEKCVHADDNDVIKEELLASNMVVFVTPVRYFGMSSQLKTAVDRFYSYTGELKEKNLKSALIAAAWDEDEDVMPCLKAHYEKIADYLHFTNIGEILGTGCGTPFMTKNSPFMEKAYALGLSCKEEV